MFVVNVGLEQRGTVKSWCWKLTTSIEIGKTTGKKICGSFVRIVIHKYNLWRFGEASAHVPLKTVRSWCDSSSLHHFYGTVAQFVRALH